MVNVGKDLETSVVGNHEVGFAPEIRYVLFPAPALPTENSMRLVLAYPTVTRERPSFPVVFDVVELLVKRPLPVPEVA